jgi:hypothetical protein
MAKVVRAWGLKTKGGRLFGITQETRIDIEYQRETFDRHLGVEIVRVEIREIKKRRKKK